MRETFSLKRLSAALATIAVVLMPTTEARAEQRARAFTYADLRALVTGRDLRSIEDTLPLLPKELRSNVVLMHKSRSLQAGTPERPRAILFNDDASLVVSFNGDPNARGANRFEIMTFANDRFDMKSIQFVEGAPAEINERPKNCFGCHGRRRDDLHPVWDPGLVWRGAYGSQDDRFSDVEAQAYAKLSGVYRDLDLTRGADRTKIENRPNLRLGLLLMRQQAKRIARLAGGEARRTLRMLAGCDPAPPALDLSPSLTRFLPPIYGDDFTRSFLASEAPSLAQTLAVLQAQGVDIDEVPLTIEKGTNAVFDASFSFKDLLIAELARTLAPVETRSVSETPLHLAKSPGLAAIDELGGALRPHSTAALCEL